MVSRSWFSLAAIALAWVLSVQAALPQSVEPRIAFVVGNSAYAKGPISHALGDAGLVAEALRSIGFEIVEGADLGQADLMRRYREFLDKVQAAGPETVAFVYFSGYGLELEGDSFLIGTDARLERDSDLALEAVRLSDLLRTLGGAQAQARIVAIDASRKLPFEFQGRPLAPGLGALEAQPGILLSYAAAPGTLASDQQGEYGAYATAIAEMIRSPGLDLDSVFTRIRTRVHQLTQGAQTPWHVSGFNETIVLLPGEAPPAAGAPAPAPGAAVTVNAPPAPRMLRETRPMRDIGLDEAYALSIEVDTLDGYSEFLEAYPGSIYGPRVYGIVRARREALAWLRAVEINTPHSYWTYLRRYPDGIYAFDARQRLRFLSAAFAPPPDFVPIEFYDVPPPLPGEPLAYVYYEPGPPPPAILIDPPPPFFLRLPPPHRITRGPRLLPAVASIPVMPRIAPALRRPGPPIGVIGPNARPGSGSVAEPRWRRHRFDTPAQRRPTPVSTHPGIAGPNARPGIPGRQPGMVGPNARPGAPSAATAPAATAPAVTAPAITGPGGRPGPGRVPPSATAPRAPGSPPPAAGAPAPAAPAPAMVGPGRRGMPPSSAAAPQVTQPAAPERGMRPRRMPPPSAGSPRPPSISGPAPSAMPDPRHGRGGPRGPVPPSAAQPMPTPGISRGAPPSISRHAPPPPAARPAPAHPTVRAAPPPPPAVRAAPPPPTVRAAPPPPAIRAAPPAARPAPPSPPPAARAAPPAPMRATPPPPAARAAPPARAAPGAARCPIVNGKPACP